MFSRAIGEDASALDMILGNPSETESGLTSVIDMEISSRLQPTEQFMEEVKVDKAAEATCRENLSCSWPAPGTSRGHTHRHHASGEPQQVTVSAVVDISEAIRAKMASWMSRVPVMNRVTSDEEPEPEEESAPARKRMTLKLGKVTTADSYVLHKVIFHMSWFTL